MKSLLRSLMMLMALGAVSTLAMADGLNYSDFSSSAGMTLLNSAATAGNNLQLTPNQQGTFGQAWFDTLQNVKGGFTAQFQYQLTGGAQYFGLGDGFAFVIQNDPAGSNAQGSQAGGGSIGYSSWPYGGPGMSNSLAMEFNANDGELFVQSCGTGATYSQQFQSFVGVNCTLGSDSTSDLNDGAVHTVDVTYTPGDLGISIDGTSLINLNVNLSTELSLNGGNSAYVGFTAGSGGDAEYADILNFSMSPAATPEPGSIGLLLAGLSGLGLVRRLRNKR